MWVTLNRIIFPDKIIKKSINSFSLEIIVWIWLWIVKKFLQTFLKNWWVFPMFVPIAFTSCGYSIYTYLRNIQAFTNCRTVLCIHKNLCVLVIPLSTDNLNLPMFFFPLCLVASFSCPLCCRTCSLAVLN